MLFKKAAKDEAKEAALEEAEQSDFTEYRRMKREEEAQAGITKIECDCLSPYMDKTQLKDTCKNANALSLGAVVVFPAYVKPCVGFLGSDPQTALIAAISYPHGLDTTEVKMNAIKRAIKDGVDEVEVCAPMRMISDGNVAYFKRECKKIKKAAGRIPARLVIDCEVLRGAELNKICSIAVEAGITCLRLNGADGDVLAAVRKSLRDKCTLKADGVESFSSFARFVVLGADYMGSKNALALAKAVTTEVHQ